MDGENNAAQGGQVETPEAGATAQTGGNPQDSGGGASPAQEVAASEGASAISAASKAENADPTAQLAERDNRISKLEAQLADQKVDHELQLAGCRSARAAKALLDEHGGDVAALKEAEPWLFSDSSQTGCAGKVGVSRPVEELP